VSIISLRTHITLLYDRILFVAFVVLTCVVESAVLFALIFLLVVHLVFGSGGIIRAVAIFAIWRTLELSAKAFSVPLLPNHNGKPLLEGASITTFS
jgi:hypothetical protein